MKNLMKGLLFLGLTFCGVCAQGQRVAVKTNLLYDALYTVNLGMNAGGNIGSCSPKRAIGFATDLQDIFWECIYWAVNII